MKSGNDDGPLKMWKDYRTKRPGTLLTDLRVDNLLVVTWTRGQRHTVLGRRRLYSANEIRWYKMAITYETGSGNEISIFPSQLMCKYGLIYICVIDESLNNNNNNLIIRYTLNAKKRCNSGNKSFTYVA